MPTNLKEELQELASGRVTQVLKIISKIIETESITNKLREVARDGKLSHCMYFNINCESLRKAFPEIESVYDRTIHEAVETTIDIVVDHFKKQGLDVRIEPPGVATLGNCFKRTITFKW
jgi:sugar-specific transcriptional regulator TrmB